MPSIWITSNPRPERSRAIHSFSRAADSATKRREAADFDRPEPLGAGTSPSGKRTERLNLRVESGFSGSNFGWCHNRVKWPSCQDWMMAWVVNKVVAPVENLFSAQKVV